MSHLARIADLVLDQPLLITPAKAEVIASVLAGRIGLSTSELSRFEGTPLVLDEQGRAKVRPYQVAEGGIAIISVVGSLVNRGAWVGANSGLTSYEGIQHQLKVAAGAAEVRSIVLDVASPGGEAIGAFETAEMVRNVNATKPVVALVNGMACSAAYAIASGAGEIVTVESGVSGSIGVVTLHFDASGMLAKDGVKATLIYAGSHKVDGNPFGPLPDAVRSDLQARVDSIYSAFTTTVAKGRGGRLTEAKARATEARIFRGQDAVAAGLADRVGTFDQVLAQLRGARPATPSTTTPQHKGPSAMSTTIHQSVAAPQASTPAVAATTDWAAEYASSPALQSEFVSAESYAALKRAEQRGGAKVHKGAVQTR